VGVNTKDAEVLPDFNALFLSVASLVTVIREAGKTSLGLHPTSHQFGC
jgi:hypothetical protein